MTDVRPAPNDNDTYRYDLDAVQYGGTGLGGPTLRDILVSACAIGDDEGVHDDATAAESYAEICDNLRVELNKPGPLTLAVWAAREVYEACMSAWSYADQNNYGADDEPDPDARNFGAHGKFMLQHLTFPWAALTLTDDGNHGFKRVE